MGERTLARDEEFRSFVTGRWPRPMRTAFLLTAYVRRVMINSHARKHRRRLKEFLAPRDDSGLVREVPDTGDRIAQADDRSALLTALAQLPPRQREAVVLRYGRT